MNNINLNNAEITKNYKNYHNQLTKMIETTENKYCQNLIDDINKNKVKWKTIRLFSNEDNKHKIKSIKINNQSIFIKYVSIW